MEDCIKGGIKMQDYSLKEARYEISKRKIDKFLDEFIPAINSANEQNQQSITLRNKEWSMVPFEKIRELEKYSAYYFTVLEETKRDSRPHKIIAMVNIWIPKIGDAEFHLDFFNAELLTNTSQLRKICKKYDRK